MKNKIKTILAFVLSLSICSNMLISTYAANENNTQGITFSATLDNPTISVSEQDQTVVMRFDASTPIDLAGIQADITWDSPLELTAVTNADTRIDFTSSVNEGLVRWNGTDQVDLIEDIINIVTATFTVPANTPAGSYTINVDNVELCDEQANIIEDGATASAILTITDTDNNPAEGYTAGLKTLTPTPQVGDVISINVGVTHDQETVFAAGEIKVSYDNTKLSLNQGSSSLGTATVKDDGSTLILEDYGSDKSTGNAVYVLCFNAIANGEGTVAITSAGFVNKENAVQSDLIDATLSPASISLTISKKTHTVSLPDIFLGAEVVTEGEEYTFSLADSNNYDYDFDTFAATMNGEAIGITDNGDGTYTVKNITGPLVITGSRTEKVYNVIYTGNGAGDVESPVMQATYNTDYTFSMPVMEGWAYALDSITIKEKAYTGYSVQDGLYTIPGAAINGDIVITISKTQTSCSVTVEGNGAGAAAGYDVVAKIGESYTLTLSPELGYDYFVSATMGGDSVNVADNGDNTYTIDNVTGEIVFTVDRSVNKDNVSISQYVTLDGTIMWLVKNQTTVAENKAPTYGGEVMFQSSKYEDVYCYLVIADTLSVDDAKGQVGISEGTATAISVDYGMDVNKTGKVDAADAQLVYNMYNAEYNAFTTEATVEKFLRADINGDEKISVEDAVAIIVEILK